MWPVRMEREVLPDNGGTIQQSASMTSARAHKPS